MITNKDHKIMAKRVKKEKKFFRDCPSCSKKVGYTTSCNRDRSVKLNNLCRSCGHKGKHHSAETKAKMSAAKKGKTLTTEHRAKIGAAHKGKTLTAEHYASLTADYQKKREAYTKLYGEKIEYPKHHFAKWSIDVKTRDNWTCKRCNTKATGHYINAHHIVPSQYFSDQALDLSNGVTLCKSCHNKIHRDLEQIALEGTKLTLVGFQDHAKQFINDYKASYPSTNVPTEYKSVFSPLVNIVKE